MLEDSWQFRPNRKEIVQESSTTGIRYTVIPGTLSICDCVNGNKRKYPRKVWENNLKDGSVLTELIKRNAAFGLLEHPADGNINLLSPISHLVTEVKLQDSGEVIGKIRILDTNEGRKLCTLIDAGYDPLVSSRGFGSLVKDGEVDVVQEDFICKGWDVVIEPSFTAAQLIPNRTEHKAANESVAKSISEPVVSAAKAIAENAAPSAPITRKVNMDLKEIRESVSTMSSVNPTSLTPNRVADGFTRIADLHRVISEAQATDPKLAWDCSRLHEELQEVEKSWNKALSAPKEEVTKLTEDRKKLIAVVEATAEAAKLYRSQLTETLSKLTRRNSLFEEVMSRGRGWKSLAEKSGAETAKANGKVEVACEALDILAAKFNKLKEQFEVSCEALDMLAETYHSDTTKLATKLVKLQLGEKLTDSVAKQLAECETAAQVLQIKEALIKDEGEVAKSKDADNKGKDATGAVKKAQAAKDPEKPKSTSESVETQTEIKESIKPNEGLIVIKPENRDPRSIAESISISRRLSVVEAK